MKKPNKGSHLVTCIFYSLYSLVILVYIAGMCWLHHWLDCQLIAFEAAAQPSVKSEEIFETYFSQPDWALLYEEAGLTDTVFEGKDAFVAQMTALMGDMPLIWEEMPGQPEDQLLYRVFLDNREIGSFTLVNAASTNSRIPDWQLDRITLQPERQQSVQIIKLDCHTAYVNGQPLDDSYTVEIRSTAAEEFLPAGTQGVRMHRQQVNGLMVQPEVTVLDENGGQCALKYDAETQTYTQILPQAELISPELAERAIAAGEAYCGFLTNRGTGLLSLYFAPGSDAYRQITAMDRWTEWKPTLEFSDQTLSEYTRYTEDLFSVRVAMTVDMTFRYDPDPTDELSQPEDYVEKTETRSMDTVFFLEHRKSGWTVTGMTEESPTQPTSRVRLTFLYGDSCLSSAFYDSTDREIYAPLITSAEGGKLIGWETQDGSAIIGCDETGKLDLDGISQLPPMTLYPVFDNGNTESEDTP